jgi:hypothetical protein
VACSGRAGFSSVVGAPGRLRRTCGLLTLRRLVLEAEATQKFPESSSQDMEIAKNKAVTAQS